MTRTNSLFELTVCLQLEVPYYCSSDLPIAKGIPVLSGPSANLSLLTIENNILSMGQKTLLEWHYCFGHLGLQQVQFILRHFPFSTQKYSTTAKFILTLCKICDFAKACRRSKGALLIKQ